MPADPERSPSRGVRAIYRLRGGRKRVVAPHSGGPFPFLSLSTFSRSSSQAGCEAGPTASTIRVRPSTSRRRTFARESPVLLGYLSRSPARRVRLAPLVYLFAISIPRRPFAPRVLPPLTTTAAAAAVQPPAPDTGHFANARRFASILGYPGWGIPQK